MLMETLYLVMLKSRPAINLLFDSEAEAEKYADNIDGRRIRYSNVCVIPLTHYLPVATINHTKGITKARGILLSAISDIDILESKVAKLTTIIGG